MRTVSSRTPILISLGVHAVLAVAAALCVARGTFASSPAAIEIDTYAEEETLAPPLPEPVTAATEPPAPPASPKPAARAPLPAPVAPTAAPNPTAAPGPDHGEAAGDPGVSDKGLALGDGADEIGIGSGGAGGGIGSGKGGGGGAPPLAPAPVVCAEAATLPEPIVRFSAIRYPEQAMNAEREGRVLVRLAVDESGAVSKAEVTQHVHPALDAAAIAAGKRWRFRPARRCNAAVTSTFMISVRFELVD